MHKVQLAQWLAAGLSLSEIGRRAGKDPSTVGYWVRRHGLVANGRAKHSPHESGCRDLPKFTRRVCRTHGTTEYVLEASGYYRCKACRKQRVIEWRRRAKLRLINEAGGCCRLCSYDRYSGALHFHHLDPGRKEFGLAKRGFTRSIERMRAEAAKCVLLCSNCHAEVEAGIATLPTSEDGVIPHLSGPG